MKTWRQKRPLVISGMERWYVRSSKLQADAAKTENLSGTKRTGTKKDSDMRTAVGALGMERLDVKSTTVEADMSGPQEN